MNDILNEKIGIRYFIGALIATVIFTVSIIGFVEVRTVAQTEFLPVARTSSQNRSDIVDLKVVIGQQKVMQANFVETMRTLRIALENMNRTCKGVK